MYRATMGVIWRHMNCPSFEMAAKWLKSRFPRLRDILMRNFREPQISFLSNMNRHFSSDSKSESKRNGPKGAHLKRLFRNTRRGPVQRTVERDEIPYPYKVHDTMHSRS